MRLRSARVTKFKSVTDSGQFDLDERVTALVGKNEAGKTAVLEAMYRHNPLASGHPTAFQELRDYPRRYRARDRSEIASTVPVSLTYEIEAGDRQIVAEQLGPGAIAADSAAIARHYGDDTRYWTLEIDEMAILRHLVEKAGLDPRKYISTDRVSTIAQLLGDEDAPAATQLANSLNSRDLPREVRALLQARIPRFQYFNDYNILPGAVSVSRLQNTPEAELGAGERTALALLRLAGVDGEEFTEAEYEARKAALEAAANSLTDELFEYWTQNDGLEVELDIEFRATPQYGAGTTEPWLQIRVRNTKHRVTLNMAERSNGFIWFFSFLAAFSEYAKAGRRVILLDEPGLNLHAKAQNDLLRFIEDRLAPHHQVIYSTHSLFMIEPTKLERCRTVEDVGDSGTQVSSDIWAARADTVFPLLGALGVDLTQTLIIGPDQLLVEGPADVSYFAVMSDLLRRRGGTPLDTRWKVTPVGGIDKIPTFVALMGGELNVTVVMDVSAGGNQRVADLVRRGILESNRLVPLTDITGTPEADIEDLFAKKWYLKLLKASGVGVVTEKQLTGGRIVKQVESVIGRFDHFQPASYLTRSPTPLIEEIDEDVQARFSRLFERLNKLLT